jgi:WD40 repeat protein
MDPIVALTLDSNISFIAMSLGSSIAIYSVEPMKRKFQKEFFNIKIKSIAVSNEGTLVVFTAIPINKPSGNQTVFIYSTYFEEPEKQLDFTVPIQNIVLRKKHILIIMQTSICVYNTVSKEIHYEQITAQNDFGAGDINLDDDEPTIAVCGLVQGTVRVSHVTDERPILFQAHQHQLAKIKFSPDSSLIATASTEGTIIKLFDAAIGTPLASFRRGTLPSKILAIAISIGNSLLAVLSENATVHFFPADARVGENDDLPRAMFKVYLDKMVAADMMFKTNGTLVVIASNGFMYEIDTKGRKITNKILTLSH